jgi:hypothetical protein
MSQLISAGRLMEIPGAGHFDLIDPESRAWPRVLSILAGSGKLPHEQSSPKSCALLRSSVAAGHSIGLRAAMLDRRELRSCRGHGAHRPVSD